MVNTKMIAITLSMIFIASVFLAPLVSDNTESETSIKTLAIPANVFVMEESTEKVNELKNIQVGKIIQLKSVPTIDNAGFYNELADRIAMGIPVVNFEGPELFTSDNFDVPTAFSPDSMASGIYCDPTTGKITSYSVTCHDMNTAISKVYEWANECTEKTTSLMEKNNSFMSRSSVGWGSEYTPHESYHEPNYGMLNIETNYFEQITNSDTKRYYLAMYTIQVVPNDDRRTADIILDNHISYNRPGQELLDYGPTTSIGSSSTGVSLNWSVSTGGIGVGGSKSWTYNAYDVEIRDHSDFGQEKLGIWHDINENAPVGSNSYYIKPGYVASSLKSIDNGSYWSNDKYTVQYFEWGPLGDQGPLKSFNIRVNININ